MTVFVIALARAERDYLLKVLERSEPLDELCHTDLTEILENALSVQELRVLRELVA